ncbi:DoxX family membrane protein [Streptomyces zhihengii]
MPVTPKPVSRLRPPSRTSAVLRQPGPARRRTTRIVDDTAVRLARHGPVLLRWSVGLVFLWFGVLKLFPGTSPAEAVAVRAATRMTFGVLPADAVAPLLALMETAIGVGLLTGLLLPLTLAVFFCHMAGVFLALVLLADEMWQDGFLVPTMEGQYIVKNVVLVAAGLVVAAGERNRAARSRRHRPHPCPGP